MEVKHQAANCKFYVEVDGVTAHVDYVQTGNVFDITHTIVPKEIGGRGIAALLVKTAYSYALEQGWQLKATCSYAAAWLQRHPVQG